MICDKHGPSKDCAGPGSNARVKWMICGRKGICSKKKGDWEREGVVLPDKAELLHN